MPKPSRASTGLLLAAALLALLLTSTTRNGRAPSKPTRRRRARADLWMMAAIQIEASACRLEGTDPTHAPPEQWPADDPFIELCRTHNLSPTEVAGLTREIAQSLENSALRAGFDGGDPAPRRRHKTSAAATLVNVRALLPYLGGHADMVRRALDGE